MGLFGSSQESTAPSEPAEARLEATVSGRVQGVGFRWWARGVAQENGLVGYAKNLFDGTVEIVAEGSRAGVDEMLAALRSGNTAGKVEHVDEQITEPEGTFSDFGTY